MQDWLNWFISLVSTSVDWLSQMQIFGVSVLSFLIGLVIMGVVLRALLYKA